jgi:hypothetical protein
VILLREPDKVMKIGNTRIQVFFAHPEVSDDDFNDWFHERLAEGDPDALSLREAFVSCLRTMGKKKTED